jgi:hypothetical protein
VYQYPGDCTFTIDPTKDTFKNAGGKGKITVTQTSDTGDCDWTAESNVDWMQILSGGSGTGSGEVTYLVDENTADERMGIIEVAGNNLYVYQDPGDCVFSISPTSDSFGSDGGSGSVKVIKKSETTGCDWTAVSNVKWIKITSGSSGTDSGLVTYSVSQYNVEGIRKGTLTIAGQTHTVTQIAIK